jgi:hypothetical protein
VLAAITIVAYAGITNRANDATVQSDFQSTAKSLTIYKTLNGTYPYGASIETMLSGANLKFSRGVYDVNPATSNANLFYVGDSTGEHFALVAKSKSGKTMYYSSKVGGVRDYPLNSFPQSGGTTIKDAVDIDSANPHVWGVGSGIWSSWVKQ